jgi:hypothetical protein
LRYLSRRPKGGEPVNRPVLIALLLCSLLAPRALAKEEKAGKKPAAASKEALKSALKTFKKEIREVDLDLRIEAVGKFAKCVHPDVAAKLMSLAVKSRDSALRHAAVRGLSLQTASKSSIRQWAKPRLVRPKGDSTFTATLVRSVGAVECRGLWKEIAALLLHPVDEVVIAAFGVLGDWKEARAYAEIVSFWKLYPKENRWETGSTTVGKGGDYAAWLKWKKKYGGPEMRRPRPNCVRALKAAVAKITGEKIDTHEKFQKWTVDHLERLWKTENGSR